MAGVTIAGGLVVAGCGKQSLISSKSPQSHAITLLWWWMLAIAGLVFLGTVVFLAIGYFTRRSPGLPFIGRNEPVNQGLVLLFGIGVPLVVLVALFGVSDVYLIRQTSAPAPNTTAMTIQVIGHQWWWEVRYDNGRAVTANEIHIPARTRVNIVATTADVIHSFWVPQLNRKIDMVPGQRNRELLYASQPGVYRGQCSQYCGLQHANMAMLVVAQPAAAFHAWLSKMSSPAASPTSSTARAGERLFMNSQCSSCHFIAGTPAHGTVGPDLTHVASRSTLAANTIPNNPESLAAWIRDPQAIKPGDRMPDLGLSNSEVSQLVAYLDGLK